jgi:ATP-dependent Clp protease adaptor protein ClpS
MDTKEKVDTLLKETNTAEHELVLYDDDFNTFDHVIECLIRICNHAVNQAEQCTYIVHYNGKCSVKKGGFEQLEPMLLALKSEQLTAEIK